MCQEECREGDDGRHTGFTACSRLAYSHSVGIRPRSGMSSPGVVHAASVAAAVHDASQTGSAALVAPPAPDAAVASANDKDEITAAIATAAKAKIGKGEQLISTIARLKAEQAQLKSERAKVSKDLKNAQKRKLRLRSRARQLTDADLLEVLQMRAFVTAKSSSERPCALPQPPADVAALDIMANPATPVADGTDQNDMEL